MAQVVGILRLDLSGCEPMWASFRSLATALAEIDFEGALPFEVTQAGVECEGRLIASIQMAGPVDWVVRAIGQPSIYLPLFVSKMLSDVPPLRVEWRGPWPHFSALPRDGEGEEPDPTPLVPEMLTC